MDIKAAFAELCNAEGWAACQRVIWEHPHLLDEGADEVVRQVMVEVRSSGNGERAVGRCAMRYVLLGRCREIGVDRAMDELAAIEAADDTWSDREPPAPSQDARSRSWASSSGSNRRCQAATGCLN